MTADFWGLPTAGGTATAYGLLTSALSEDPSLDVRGVPSRLTKSAFRSLEFRILNT